MKFILILIAIGSSTGGTEIEAVPGYYSSLETCEKALYIAKQLRSGNRIQGVCIPQE